MYPQRLPNYLTDKDKSDIFDLNARIDASHRERREAEAAIDTLLKQAREAWHRDIVDRHAQPMSAPIASPCRWRLKITKGNTRNDSVLSEVELNGQAASFATACEAMASHLPDGFMAWWQKKWERYYNRDGSVEHAHQVDTDRDHATRYEIRVQVG